MFKKIAIIGVGLIGGSIGLALRKKGLAKEVIGIGRRSISLRNAIRKGAIDKGTLDMKEGVKDADLIIVATPSGIVAKKIKETARFAKKGAIIIDVNSTKNKVVDYADRLVRKKASFVGTHPIAGSENTGVLKADAGLFEGTVCIITPTKKTGKASLKKISALWRSLGADTEFLSPAEHDRVVANVSHLPHIISFSLCHALPQKDLKFAGSGFKDTTRIAASSPRMWSEIFLQNKQNLLRSVERFEASLKLLKADIRKNRKTDLIKKLNLARDKRLFIENDK